jgi:hypothetical protein
MSPCCGLRLKNYLNGYHVSVKDSLRARSAETSCQATQRSESCFLRVSLFIVENMKGLGWSGLQWRNVYSKFLTKEHVTLKWFY